MLLSLLTKLLVLEELGCDPAERTEWPTATLVTTASDSSAGLVHRPASIVEVESDVGN